MSFAKKPKRINPDEVDPSIYCYDEVYDDMKNEEEKERQSMKEANCLKQSSKYIQGLIETAERRNTEKELRKFKKFAKEREDAQAMGELNDEEVFVTSGYKKKLEEIKVLEEETRRRLKDEEGSSMNFVKSNARKNEPLSKQMQQSCDKPVLKTSIEDSPAEKTNQMDNTKETIDCNNEHKPLDQNLSKPKVFETNEERRAYLKEILAKRTVGKVFDEAVSRYKLRRVHSSS